VAFPAVFSIVFLAALVSCGQKEAPRNVSEFPDPSLSPPEDARAVQGPAAQGYGYALRISTGLYAIKNDTGAETDVAEWSAGIPMGESMEILNKSRKASWYNDKKVYEFVQVRRDNGKEGLVFANQLSSGGRLAVVVDDRATIYRNPQNVAATGNILSVKTVLAFFPETEKDGFVEFKAYDAGNQTLFRDSFIKTAVISTREADIQSSILLQTANAVDERDPKELIRKAALLDAALMDYPDSVFAAEIRELVSPGSSSPSKVEVQASGKSFMVVNDDNVNVRDAVNGEVIFQLSLGAELTVTEETVETFTINGAAGKWYHAVEPVDGWIFGAYLE
jgi:hypothetical protein